MTETTHRGVLGYRPKALPVKKITELGALKRGRAGTPGIVLKPAEAAAPTEDVTKSDKWDRKLKLGTEIYDELGLAGQIARKFVALPYRKGKGITFKTGKLAGTGLVCTSFAKIFGALWFADERDDGSDKPWLKQERLGSQTVKVRPRRAGEDGKAWKIVRDSGGKEKPKDIIGETDTKWEADASARDRNAAAEAENKGGGKGISLSPALVYADKFGGTRVNEERLRLKDLVDYLDRTRLYAMLTYKSRKGASPKHVWFLVHTDSSGWVRIEATGSLSGAGSGAGPGIYKLKQPIPKKKNWYQAWDWGHWYKARDADIDTWEFD